jgi:hypothetical protein
MIAVYVLAMTACIMTPSLSLDVYLTGSYTESIDANDLLTGAGSELVSSYESASDQVVIDIANSSGPGDAWRIDVNKSDVSWDGSITISVKRTSDGTGGAIAGGTSYLEIVDSAQQFFTGIEDITGIDLQYKVDNISIGIDPGNYNTVIVYTVVDL